MKGTTTYVYAGWGVKDNELPLDELCAKAHGKIIWQRLNRTDVLVIDEISMVEASLFDRLNAYLKAARNNEKAFGGVQVIVTGDVSALL